jgi:ELWxxDGT repeat protein
VVYFVADNGVNGYELWRSDGTAAGTVLVKDILPGLETSYPSSLTNINGVLYFGANNGVHGREVWRNYSGAFRFSPSRSPQRNEERLFSPAR